MSQVLELKALDAAIKPGVDLFICCASYEDRCTAAAFNISDASIGKALICYHHEFLPHVSENLNKLKALFKNKGVVVKVSNSLPIITADAITSEVKKVLITNNEAQVVVDVTTFTRESLLILIKVLWEIPEVISRTRFVYTGSKAMSYEWLSSGLKELRPILGFAGDFSPSLPSHLIILLGFETERAKEIINNSEPSMLSIGIGREDASITNEFYEKNKAYLNELCQFYGYEFSPFYYSLTDPVMAMQDIKRHLETSKNANHIIAPLNNKISTIGAGLLALSDSKIQLCYSQMEVYNYTNYSTSSDICYLFDIKGSHI